MKRISLILMMSMLALTACEPDDDIDDDPKVEEKGTVQYTVQLMNGQDKVELNDTISMTAEYDFYLSLFKLYLARLSAVNSGGETHMARKIAITDPANDSANFFYGQLPIGSYDRLKIGYGVDANQNNADPGSFANEHPLSSYQSMYWSMLKYRFAKFEGKAKSRISGTSNIFVAYHPGTDQLYQRKTYNTPFSITKADTAEVLIQIDINEIVDGPAGSLDFETEPQTHSAGPSEIAIAQKFMENLAASADVSVSSP